MYNYSNNVLFDSRAQNDPLNSEKLANQIIGQNVRTSLVEGQGDCLANHVWLDGGHRDRLATAIGHAPQTPNEHLQTNVQVRNPGSHWNDGLNGLSNMSNPVDTTSQSTHHVNDGSYGLSDVRCTTSHMPMSSNGINVNTGTCTMTQGNACITSQVQGASSEPYSPQYSIPHPSSQPYGEQNSGQRNEQKVTHQGAYHQPSNLIHGQFQSHTPTHVHGQSNQAPYHVPNNTYHHMYHQAPMHIGQVPHDSMQFGTNGFAYVDQFVPGGYHYGSYPYYPSVYPPWCYVDHQYPDYNCYHGYPLCRSGHHRYVQGHSHIPYPHNHYHQPVGQCHEDPHGNPKQTIQHPCYQQKTNVETNSNLGTTYSNMPNEQSAEHQQTLEPADKQYTGYVHQHQNTQQQPHNIDQHHLTSIQNNNRDSYNTALIAHTFDSNKVQTTFNEQNASSSQKHCQSVAVRSTIHTPNDDNKHISHSCYVIGECGYQIDDQVTRINDHNCQNGNHVCQNSDQERTPTPSYQLQMGGEDGIIESAVSLAEIKQDHCQDSQEITGYLNSTSILAPTMPIKGYRHKGNYMYDIAHSEPYMYVMGNALSVCRQVGVYCQSYRKYVMKGQDSVPWECWEDRTLLQ